MPFFLIDICPIHKNKIKDRIFTVLVRVLIHRLVKLENRKLQMISRNKIINRRMKMRSSLFN